MTVIGIPKFGSYTEIKMPITKQIFQEITKCAWIHPVTNEGKKQF